MQVVNIQPVQVTIAGGQTQGTATLDGTGTLAQMVVTGTWTLPDISDLTESKSFVDLDVTNLTTLTATRDDSTAAEAINIEAYVIEYGADTNVYKGTFTSTGTGTGGWLADDFNINGGSPMALADLTKAFCWAYWTNDWTGGTADWHPSEQLGFWFKNTSEMTVRRGSQYGSLSGHYYVVESSTLTVEHGRLNAGTASDASFTQAITTVDQTESFVVASFEEGEGTYHSDGHWAADFASDSLVRMRRGASGGSGDSAMRYQIISDPALTVQRGEFTYSTVAAVATLTTPVNLAVAVPISGGITGTPASPGDEWHSGWADSHSHRMWLLDDDSLEVRATTAGTGRIVPWQVIEFEAEAGGAPVRRVMVRG